MTPGIERVIRVSFIIIIIIIPPAVSRDLSRRVPTLALLGRLVCHAQPEEVSFKTDTSQKTPILYDNLI